MITAKSYPISLIRNGGPDYQTAQFWYNATIGVGAVADLARTEIDDGAFVIDDSQPMIQWLSIDPGRGPKTLYFEVLTDAGKAVTIAPLLFAMDPYTLDVGTSTQIPALPSTTVVSEDGWKSYVCNFDMDYDDNAGGLTLRSIALAISQSVSSYSAPYKVKIRRIGLCQGHHAAPTYWGDPYKGVIPAGAIIMTPSYVTRLEGFEEVVATGILCNSAAASAAHADTSLVVEYSYGSPVGHWLAQSEMPGYSTTNPVFKWLFGNTSRDSTFETENFLTYDDPASELMNQLVNAANSGRASQQMYIPLEVCGASEHVHPMTASFATIYYKKHKLWRALP